MVLDVQASTMAVAPAAGGPICGPFGNANPALQMKRSTRDS